MLSRISVEGEGFLSSGHSHFGILKRKYRWVIILKDNRKEDKIIGLR